MESERRGEPRVLLRRKAEVSVDGGEAITTYTGNLSRGGLLVELATCPKVGARMRLRLALTEGAPIEVRGTVRHTTRVSLKGPAGREELHLVGVQFEALAAEVIELIDATLAAEEAED